MHGPGASLAWRSQRWAGMPGSTLGDILVAIDFSAASRHAAERAARLPRRAGAALTLLHVRAPGAPGREVERELAALEQQVLRGAAPGRVVCAQAEGPAAQTIVDRAHGARAALVVVGARGEHGLRALLLGPVSERVVRTSPVPVLVVRGEARGPYARGLWAVDAPGDDARPLEVLGALGVAPSAIEVLHVERARERSYTPEGRQAILERGRERLEAWLARHAPGVVFAEQTVRIGDPRRLILARAKRERIDLVALGTHGRTGAAYVLLGSVAEAVVRLCPRDVLVARRRPKG